MTCFGKITLSPKTVSSMHSDWHVLELKVIKVDFGISKKGRRPVFRPCLACLMTYLDPVTGGTEF